VGLDSGQAAWFKILANQGAQLTLRHKIYRGAGLKSRKAGSAPKFEARRGARTAWLLYGVCRFQ
jgi:hypothetical protein